MRRVWVGFAVVCTSVMLFGHAFSQDVRVQPVHAQPDPCEEKPGTVIGPSCGLAYERGTFGKTQDYNKASELYRVSAEKGDPVAQDLLGRLYRDGHGVKKSCAESAKWFRKAAEQLSNDAKADLGNLYAQGCSDLPPDFKEAYFWLSLPHWPHIGDLPRLSDGRILSMAYDHDPPCIDDALRNSMGHLSQPEIVEVARQVETWVPPNRPADDRGDCNANGNGVIRQGVNKVTWCFNAAQKGYEPAMENLGGFYNSGSVDGINKDYREAYFWWSVAIQNMTPERAKQSLAVVTTVRDAAAKKLNPEEKSALDKRLQEWKPVEPEKLR